jgi:hypothetical protein
MIASRYWSIAVPVFYVAAVKPGVLKRGAVGDWEYTTAADKAIELTPYQFTRFAADCRAVGVTARSHDYMPAKAAA